MSSEIIPASRLAKVDLASALVVGMVFAAALTPTVRLTGNIPLRIDDLLTLIGVGYIALRVAFTGKIVRPDPLLAVLVIQAIYVFADSFTSWYLGAPVPSLSVGPKELLDVGRPIKFIVIVLLCYIADGVSLRRRLSKALPVVAIILSLMAFLQIFFVRSSSTGLMPNLFLAFSELNDSQVRDFFGRRAFATFNTPTDYGFYSALTLAAAFFLKDTNRRSLVMLLSIIGIIISSTRTLMFSMPILMLAYFALFDPDRRNRVKKLLWTFSILGCSAVVFLAILPSILGDFSADAIRTVRSLTSGDYENDESISNRLKNLELMEIAWEHAKVTGIVSRDAQTEAYDSEIIMVFYRYGMLGLGVMGLFYIGAATKPWYARRSESNLSHLAFSILIITFLYGITQGALMNTRVGIFPIVLLATVTGEIATSRFRARYISSVPSSVRYAQ